MMLLTLPWLEWAIASALLGSLWVSQLREPNRAARWGIAFTGLAFACTFLAWLGFYLQVAGGELSPWSIQAGLFGRPAFTLDELSAPLVPAVALLHLMTAATTARTRMRYFSFAWSLASDAIRLMMFSCAASWLLIKLLIICAVPPYLELVNRGRPTRVYLLHMVTFSVLLAAGWWLVDNGSTTSGSVLLMLAILIRSGTAPAHCWVTDWFEHASFGNALLFVAPLTGVYAAVRLVLPIAPDWVLQVVGLASLATAIYAAAMGTVQRDTRRFFAYLFLSHASLVLVGLELHTTMTLCASLCLWFSVILSIGGFGLTLRALESRFGRLDLISYHGLYEHTPTLAVIFLLTGLACVGFPGTLGFISTELLVDSAVEASPWVGVLVVAAGALNGIGVVRAYFLLFTGARHVSTVSVGIGPRERIALITLAALILGGGIFPQPGVTTREHAASAILEDRDAHLRNLGAPRPPARHVPAPTAEAH